jgi:hypothetical protein
VNFYWVVDYTANSIQGPFLTVEQASMVQGYQHQAFPTNDVRVVRQEMIWLSDEQVPEPVYPTEPEDVTQPEEQP